MDAIVWWSLLNIFIAAMGICLFIVGCLLAAFIALGNQHYGWALGGVIFFPLAVLYALLHYSSSTRMAARFQWAGILILVLQLIRYRHLFV